MYRCILVKLTLQPESHQNVPLDAAIDHYRFNNILWMV